MTDDELEAAYDEMTEHLTHALDLVVGLNAVKGESSVSGKISVPRELLECFYDDSPCGFDHHGNCQNHGFFDFAPREKCPMVQLGELLKREAKE